MTSDVALTVITSNALLQFKNLGNISWIEHGMSLREEYLIYLKRFKHIVHAKQSHSADVVCVTSENLQDRIECDGLITDLEDVVLVMNHADCQIALFVDVKKRVIAAVHSGWKGSIQNIYKNCMTKLVQIYGCDPKDIHVVIGPSLGPKASEFINYKQEIPESLWHYQWKSQYFDFWQISRDQLEACGILPENIQISGICTHDNREEFFSYRRDKTKKRHRTWIALKTQLDAGSKTMHT